MTEITDFIRSRTTGEPPDRKCLPGSDEKWAGYLLGVEEAAAAAEDFIAFIPTRRNAPVAMKWHWAVSPWTAKAPKWGVEIRRRPRIRHSQIRLALGRRRFTLMCVATGQPRRKGTPDV